MSTAKGAEVYRGYGKEDCARRYRCYLGTRRRRHSSLGHAGWQVGRATVAALLSKRQIIYFAVSPMQPPLVRVEFCCEAPRATHRFLCPKFASIFDTFLSFFLLWLCTLLSSPAAPSSPSSTSSPAVDVAYDRLGGGCFHPTDNFISNGCPACLPHPK